MKNKGFTLIELLAVIVILAIIALIATPIILGIINDARTSAKDRSAEYVYEAVQLAYQTQYALNGGTVPTLYQVEARITANGLSNATLEGNVITTSDGVECTLAGDTTLTITCTGTSSSFSTPDIGTMTLATE